MFIRVGNKKPNSKKKKFSQKQVFWIILDPYTYPSGHLFAFICHCSKWAKKLDKLDHNGDFARKKGLLTDDSSNYLSQDKNEHLKRASQQLADKRSSGQSSQVSTYNNFCAHIIYYYSVWVLQTYQKIVIYIFICM